MNCAEFQKVLPYIIETGGNAEEEAHLKSCPICSDLVQDLKYIAEAAKLLLPMQDPSTRVWNGIHSALPREGLVRPVAGTARFRPQTAALNRRHWATSSGLLALAALLLFAISIIWFRSSHEAATAVSTSPPATASAGRVDADDAQVLTIVQQKSPALLAIYRENLDSVNSYISDAKRTLEKDPSDMGARDHLMRAYNEKVLLYKMALARSEQ